MPDPPEDGVVGLLVLRFCRAASEDVEVPVICLQKVFRNQDGLQEGNTFFRTWNSWKKRLVA